MENNLNKTIAKEKRQVISMNLWMNQVRTQKFILELFFGVDYYYLFTFFE
jgi:hypothetical protein